jgi:hypothetical protein
MATLILSLIYSYNKKVMSQVKIGLMWFQRRRSSNDESGYDWFEVVSEEKIF